MGRQSKKERHRLDRKKKQQRLRKDRNTSVFKKLALNLKEMEIYVNADWRERGLADLTVLRNGLHSTDIFVAFLIDTWCSGLKDAFVNLDFTTAEFDDYLDRAEDSGLEMIEITPELARRLVAGAMRLSVENGFHLPRDAARCAALIGVNDYADADLSDFDKFDGKYRYVGTEKDLAKRLVGPVDAFLRRPDVEVVLKAYSPLDDEPIDEDDYEENGHERQRFMQGMNELCERMYVAISNWLRGAGETPHPYLAEGIDIALATVIGAAAGPHPDLPSLNDMVEEFEEPDAVLAAVDQVIRFMQQFPSPEAMFESLGLPPPDIEDDDRALPSDSHN
jgi:hypothetical protein